jgi:hypothetical protein
MKRSTVWRQFLASASLLASISLAVPAPSPAARAPKIIVPRVVTGGVTHARGNAAELAGLVNPRGQETTYFFQYGRTIAYGSQTPAASAGHGTTNVKVGQNASPFLPGYHYRLVASNAQLNSTRFGQDRRFGSPGVIGRPKVQLGKPTEPSVFGSTVVLNGTVSGPNPTSHRISLQSSPFPYLEAFSAVGLPALSNAAGGFSFRVPSLTASRSRRA